MKGYCHSCGYQGSLIQIDAREEYKCPLCHKRIPLHEREGFQPLTAADLQATNEFIKVGFKPAEQDDTMASPADQAQFVRLLGDRLRNVALDPEKYFINPEEEDNMTGTIFEIIIVENPTDKQIEDHGTLSKIVAGPFYTVARNEADAIVRANTKIPESVNMDMIQVVANPF